MSRERCETCGGELLSFLDTDGAICRKFLEARGTCCDTGCRNCPYGDDVNAEAFAARSSTKRCPRCRQTFQCSTSECWCAQVRLSGPMLKWLERSFNDCLCPNCLAEYAVG